MSVRTLLRSLVSSVLLSAAAAGLVQAQTGAVRGVVFDSIAQGPLAGAAVFLWNTSHRATSDSNGRFVLSDVPAGDYTLLFFHRNFGSWGSPPARARSASRQGIRSTSIWPRPLRSRSRSRVVSSRTVRRMRA